MKNKIICLLTIFSVASLSSLYASVIYQTGFEFSDHSGYITGQSFAGVDGWILEQPDVIANVQNSFVRSGSQAAVLQRVFESSHLSTMDRNYDVIQQANLGSEEIVRYEFSMATSNGAMGAFYIRNGNTNIATIQMLSDGRFGYESGGFKIIATSGNWERDSWYDVILDMNLHTQTFDIYVSGVGVEYEATSAFQNAATQLNRIRLRNTGASGQAFFDNISVSVIPEPGHLSMAISAIALTVFLVYRRKQ